MIPCSPFLMLILSKINIERKLPNISKKYRFRKIRTTNNSKKIWRSLTLRIIEVWLYFERLRIRGQGNDSANLIQCWFSQSRSLCLTFTEADRVGYENHKPYRRIPYLNPYQNFTDLLGRNRKILSYNFWCHIKTVCIINICNEYEISELPIFEENNILVFLGVWNSLQMLITHTVLIWHQNYN